MFAFDADTRPVDLKNDFTVLTITDSLGFVLRNATDVAINNGRYYGEFQLSEFVTSGVWVIKIEVQGKVKVNIHYRNTKVYLRKLSGIREGNKR